MLQVSKLTKLPLRKLRTMSRWLGRCTAPVRAALQALNAELVALAVRPLQLGRLTIDVDGTVVRTGLQVERL